MPEAIQQTPAQTPSQAGQAAPAPAATQTPAAASEQKPQGTEPKAQGPQGDKVVPEKYDLKLPDGSFLDQGRIDKVALHAKEYGLNNEQAQKLLESEHEAVSSYAQNLQKEFESQHKGWLEAIKNDKEIGGDSYQENIEQAHRVLKRFGNEAFFKELETTKLGDHPELVRTFVRISKALSEDKLIMAGAQSPGKKSIEDIFYPTTKKE